MKRILTLISALVCIVALVTACVQQQEQSNPELQTQSATSGEVSEQTVESYLETLIGDKKYDKTFTIISVDTFNLDYIPYYFVPEEYNNEPFNDAAYERNLKLEELLGVKLEFMGTGGGGTELPITVTSQIDAGIHTFDLIAPHSIYGVISLMTDGMLLDWKSVPCIDTTKDWWYADALDQLLICGISAWAVSDFTIGQQVPFWIVFNRDMAEDYGKGNIYNTVLSGDWTLDSMAQAIKDVTVTGGETETYGATLFADELWYVVGADGYPCNRGDDGKLLFSPDAQKLSGIYDKIKAMTDSGDAVIIPYDADKYKDFSEGKVFMQTFNGVHYSQMRNFDLNIGILPLPKYDEEQDDYISLGGSGLMGLPIDTPDKEYAGLVVEVLSALSHETVKHAFIDTVLYNQCLRDDESQSMMDIMLSTRKYVNIYGNDSIGALLSQIFTTGQIQSSIDANKSAIESKLREIEDGVMQANG